MKIFKAFTLAETLMVIGLIGVVSALTLPNLSSNTNDKEYVAALKKTASEVQNAIDMGKDKFGDFSTWWDPFANADNNRQRIAERLMEYLPATKVCGKNTGCFSPSAVKDILGSDNGYSIDSDQEAYKFILKDGSSVAVITESNIFVDLDGPYKGFNTLGRDLFQIYFASNGEFNKSVPITQLNTSNIQQCREGKSFICFLWTMEFDNNDYIRCADLSYNGKTTCK